MKKSARVLFSAILLAILFAGCKNGVSNSNNNSNVGPAEPKPGSNIYMLVLEQDNIQEYGTRAIYYKETDGVGNWYSDSDATSPITKITFPKKSAKVTFVIPSSYLKKTLSPITFKNADYDTQGYSFKNEDGTQDVYIVDADGNIDLNVSISKKTRATLHMPLKEDKRIDMQYIENEYIDIDPTISTTSLDGWSEDGGLNKIELSDGIYYSPTKKEVTLSAVLVDNDITKVVFDYNKATKNGPTARYYSQSTDEWSEDFEGKKTIKSEGDVKVVNTTPEKKWSVTFDINNPSEFDDEFYVAKQDLSIKQSNKGTYEWHLGGYKDNNGTQVVDENGVYTYAYSPNYIAYNNELRLTAEWNDDANLQFPNVQEVKGWILEGWQLDGSDTIYNNETEHFYPTDDDVVNNSLTMKAKWTKNVYTVNFDNDAANKDSQGTLQAYYWKDHGWYSEDITDNNSREDINKKKISNINLPIKKYTTDFNFNLPQINGVRTVVTEYTFNGYESKYDEIDGNANSVTIVNNKGEFYSNSVVNSAISEEVGEQGTFTVKAKWIVPTLASAKPITDYLNLVNDAKMNRKRTLRSWVSYSDKEGQNKIEGAEVIEPLQDGEDKDTPNRIDTNNPKWLEKEYEYRLLKAQWDIENAVQLEFEAVVTGSGNDPILYYTADGWKYDENDSVSITNGQKVIYFDGETTPSGNYFKLQNKVCTVSYILNLGDNPDDILGKEEYKFTYKGHRIVNDDADFINGDGKFVNTLRSIDDDETTASPIWGNSNKLAGFDITKAPSNITAGYVFNGWLDNNGEIVDLTTFTPSTDDTELELRADWTPNIYKVTLARDTATTDVEKKTLWYKVGDGWYEDEETNIRISGIYTLPEKTYKIEYSLKPASGTYPIIKLDDITQDLQNELKVGTTYDFPFRGYFTDKNDDSTRIIDNNGDFVNNAKVTKDTTIYPKFNNAQYTPFLSIQAYEQEAVAQGYIWRGWSTKDGKVVINSVNSPYIPASDMFLYARWEAKPAFELTLKSNGTPANPSKIYYKVDDGWYKDAAATERITKLEESGIPTLKWSVTFDTQGGSKIQDAEGNEVDNYTVEGNIEFAGFTMNGLEVINKNGFIQTDKKIYEASTAEAKWNEESTLGVKSSPVTTRDSYTFLGWAERPESSSSTATNFVTFPYKTTESNKTLYAWWKLTGALEVTLDSNGATMDAEPNVIYNKKGGDSWYSDNNLTNSIKKLDKTPEKVWTVNIHKDNNTINSEVETLQSKFTFKGFAPNIDEKGNITSSASADGIVLRATWSDNPSAVNLDGVKPNESVGKFLGWTLKNDNGFDANSIVKYSQSFVPEKNNVDVYPYYEYTTYALNLIMDDKSTPIKTIYNHNGQWYNDAQLSTPIKTLDKKLAMRTYTLTLNTQSDGVVAAPLMSSQTSTIRSFRSINDENKTYTTEGDGVLVLTTEKMTSDDTAYVVFDEGPTYNVPNIVRKGYEFNGWSKEQKGEPLPKGQDGNTTISLTKDGNPSVTLYAQWTSIKYKLTLDPGSGASIDSAGVKAIYYDASVKKWYKQDTKDPTKYNEITSDTLLSADDIPVKEYTIKLNTNALSGEVTEPASYADLKTSVKFLGYGDIITENGEIYSYITSAGTWEKNTISSDTKVVAKWGSADSIDLSAITKPKYTGYTFQGWSEVRKEPGLGTEAQNGQYTPTYNNVNLYANWSADIYALTLNAYEDDANPSPIITPGTTTVYYKTGEGWFRDKSAQIPITKVPTLPTKQISVSYNTNTPTGYTIKPIASKDSKFEFKGFVDVNGNTIIDANGNFIETITAPSSVRAVWGNQSSITIDTPESIEGFTFKGWSELSGSGVVINPGTEWHPPVTAKNVSLHALWSENVYTLTLDTSNRTNVTEFNNSYRVYYKTNYGWFKTINDATAGTNGFSNLSDVFGDKMPESVYTVRFMADGQVYKTESATATFLGFIESTSEDDIKISSSLDISSYTITQHTTLKLKYGERNKVVVPEVPSKTGSTVQGWSNGSKAGDELSPTGDMTITAVYDSLPFTLSLTAPDSTDAPEYKDGNMEFKYTTVIYYKGGKWYIDSEFTEEITKVESLPNKITNVSFDSNLEGETVTGLPNVHKATWAFNGYFDENGNTDPLIDANGNILLKSLTQNRTAVAKFGETTGVDISNLDLTATSGHYEFEGWSLNKNGTTSDLEVSPFKPKNTLATTLYAVWTPKIYSLTLQATDATSTDFTKIIYYKYKNGWYSDKDATTQIVSITKPVKEWTVQFDSNISDVANPSDIKVQFEFLGYRFNDGGSSIYINDVASITDLIITKDSTASVTWGTAPVPTIKFQELKKTGYVNLGWSKNSLATASDTDKTPTSPKYTIKDDDRTLDDEGNKTTIIQFYAIWDTGKYTLTLSAEDATNAGNYTTTLWYESEYTRGETTIGGWFKDAGRTEKLEKTDDVFEAISIPVKEYAVSFDLLYNGRQVSTIDTIEPLKSTFEFSGFHTDERNPKEIINKDGILKSDYIISDNVTLKVKWANQTSITTPEVSTTAPGYIFNGWLTDLSLPSDQLIGENTEFPASRITGDMTLYASWTPRILTMYLETSGATSTETTTVVYHKVGSGWFSDRNATTVITSVIVPKREYRVTFEVAGDGVKVPDGFQKEVVSSWAFLGYSTQATSTSQKVTYVDNTGKLIGNLTEDVRVFVEWSTEQSSVSIPDDQIITRKDYRLQEWYEQGDSQNRIEPGIAYKPTKNITLIPSWVRIYKSVTLNNAKATNANQILAKIYNKDKKWYTDDQATSDVITKLTVLPRRDAVVSFNTGFNDVVAPSSMTASWTVEDGYFIKRAKTDGTEELVKFIDKDGNITSDFLNYELVDDITTEPLNWTESEDPKFSITNKQDVYKFSKRFLGWSTNEEGTNIVNSTWRPEESIVLYAQYLDLPSLEVITTEGIKSDLAYFAGSQLDLKLGDTTVYPYLLVTSLADTVQTAPNRPNITEGPTVHSVSNSKAINYIGGFNQLSSKNTTTIEIPYSTRASRGVTRAWVNPYEKDVYITTQDPSPAMVRGSYIRLGGEPTEAAGLWAPTDSTGQAFEKRGALLLYNRSDYVRQTDSPTSQKLRMIGADGKERAVYVVMDYKNTSPTPNNTYDPDNETIGTTETGVRKVTSVVRDFIKVYNIVAPVFGDEWGDLSGVYSDDAFNAIDGSTNGMFIPDYTDPEGRGTDYSSNGVVLYFTPLNYANAPAVYYSMDNTRLPKNKRGVGDFRPYFDYSNQSVCFIINMNYITNAKYNELLSEMASTIERAIHTFKRVQSRGYDYSSNTITQNNPGYDPFVENMFASLAKELVADTIKVAGPSNNDVSTGSFARETSVIPTVATKGSLVDYIVNQRFDLLDYVPALNRANSKTSYGTTAGGLGYSFGSYLVRNYGYDFIKEFNNLATNEYSSADAYNTVMKGAENSNNQNSNTKQMLVDAINKGRTEKVTWNDLIRNWGAAILLSADTSVALPYRLNANNAWMTTTTTPSYRIPSLNYFAYYIYKANTELRVPVQGFTMKSTSSTDHPLLINNLMYSSADALTTVGPFIYDKNTAIFNASNVDQYLYYHISNKEQIKPNTNLFISLEPGGNGGTGVKTYRIPLENEGYKYTVVLSKVKVM